MARKPTGNPVGRPQKEINWDQFEQLCALQCTQTEIANMFHIHDETLSIRVRGNYGEDYSTVYKRFADSGKCSLRRNQFVLSKTNAAMAIWLGKQWLGQKDHIPEAQVNEEINKRFIEVMQQLGNIQSERKISEINNNAA